MAEPFELGGEPAAIRASAARWGAFSAHASGASGRISRLDANEFVGPEGETYREALHSDMRPHLDTTATAWGKVNGALSTYANTLERLQERMAAIAATATTQQRALDHAQGALDDSRTADFRHRFLNSGDSGGSRDSGGSAGSAGSAGSDDGGAGGAATGARTDTYRSHTVEYSGAVSGAQRALQGSIDAANTIHSEHDAALAICCDQIDAAKAMRFVKPPGWFSRALHAVGHWVEEHAGALLKISAILKAVSGIAGILALIPVLTPIMGPVAFATGAAAFGIDLVVSGATGTWDLRTLGMDAVSLIPGSRALMEVRAVQRLGTVGRAAEAVAGSEKVWKAAAGLEQAANVGVAGYDLAVKIKDGKAGWRDYVDAATTVAATEVGVPRAVRRRLHLGDRDFRKVNAIKDVAVTAVDAGTSGYDLAVKIKNGKAGLGDFVDTAGTMAAVASNTATVTKYRGPGDTGQYQPGRQMHHRAWEAPEYTGADTTAALSNALHHARTAVGSHLAAAALVASLHSGPRLP